MTMRHRGSSAAEPERDGSDRERALVQPKDGKLTAGNRRWASRIIFAVGLAATVWLVNPGEVLANTPMQVPRAFPAGGSGLDMKRLAPGTRRYLRYVVRDGQRTPIDMWTRTVSYEDQEGHRRLHIVQRWEPAVSSAPSVVQDSWFDAATFRPLTHVARATINGKTTTSGYRFGERAVTGLENLQGNIRSEFRLDTEEPTFNFEYDIELLQTIPWRAGLAADLVFYDPGREPPTHYVFKVVGEVSIALPGGGQVACWLVTSDYNHPERPPTRFWIAKATGVTLHEEAEYQGATYVKTLLTPDQLGGRP